VYHIDRANLLSMVCQGFPAESRLRMWWRFFCVVLVFCPMYIVYDGFFIKDKKSEFKKFRLFIAISGESVQVPS